MTDYKTLAGQAEGMLEAEPWYAAAFSNISALVMATVPDLNWAGFYLMRNGKLTVGPFQGKPACIHIAPGKGVCGTAEGRLPSCFGGNGSAVSAGIEQFGTLDSEIHGNIVDQFFFRHGVSVFPVGHGTAHEAENLIQRGFTQVAGLT